MLFFAKLEREYQTSLSGKGAMALLLMGEMLVASLLSQQGAVASVGIATLYFIIAMKPFGVGGAEAGSRAAQATPSAGGTNAEQQRWLAAQWASLLPQGLAVLFVWCGLWAWHPNRELVEYSAALFPALWFGDVVRCLSVRPLKTARIGEGLWDTQVKSAVLLAGSNFGFSLLFSQVLDGGLLGVGLGTLASEVVAAWPTWARCRKEGIRLRPKLEDCLECWRGAGPAVISECTSALGLVARTVVLMVMSAEHADVVVLVTQCADAGASLTWGFVGVTKKKTRRAGMDPKVWEEAKSLHMMAYAVAVVFTSVYAGFIGGLQCFALCVVDGLNASLWNEVYHRSTAIYGEKDELSAKARTEGNWAKMSVWLILMGAGWLTPTTFVISALIPIAVIILRLRGR